MLTTVVTRQAQMTNGSDDIEMRSTEADAANRSTGLGHGLISMLQNLGGKHPFLHASLLDPLARPSSLLFLSSSSGFSAVSPVSLELPLSSLPYCSCVRFLSSPAIYMYGVWKILMPDCATPRCVSDPSTFIYR